MTHTLVDLKRLLETGLKVFKKAFDYNLNVVKFKERKLIVLESVIH